MKDKDQNEVMISMDKNEFAEKVAPIKVANADELFLFKCECGHVHFRHAGYVEVLMPYMRGDKSKNVANDSVQVMICTKCKNAYAWLNDQMYNVTELIDMEAWEKTEKEAYATTGPGGQC